mmetsp:Transcript_26805/g.71835  ORF Transcript_26805/g.71835 Transcript_26805/m.71835 type:complete len:208 (-) Transcript_26805:163-786(-)
MATMCIQWCSIQERTGIPHSVVCPQVAPRGFVEDWHRAIHKINVVGFAVAHGQLITDTDDPTPPLAMTIKNEACSKRRNAFKNVLSSRLGHGKRVPDGAEVFVREHQGLLDCEDPASSNTGGHTRRDELVCVRWRPGRRLHCPLSSPKKSYYQTGCRHVKGQPGRQVHFTADHIFQLGIQLNQRERIQASFGQRRVGVNVLAADELL